MVTKHFRNEYCIVWGKLLFGIGSVKIKRPYTANVGFDAFRISAFGR